MKASKQAGRLHHLHLEAWKNESSMVVPR